MQQTGSQTNQENVLLESPNKQISPEQHPKDSPPKLIEGQLAVCAICGYLSEDFNRCMRCKRKLPENVKAIPAVNTNGKKMDARGSLGEKKLGLQKTNGEYFFNFLL